MNNIEAVQRISVRESLRAQRMKNKIEDCVRRCMPFQYFFQTLSLPFPHKVSDPHTTR